MWAESDTFDGVMAQCAINYESDTIDGAVANPEIKISRQKCQICINLFCMNYILDGEDLVSPLILSGILCTSKDG